MKVVKKINVSMHELEDILLYYLIDKQEYPSNVKEKLMDLYKTVINEINKEEGNRDIDLVDVKTYLVEKTSLGNINRVEIDWDSYILNNFIELYIGNKSSCYQKNVNNIIEELRIENSKHIIKYGKILEEDVEEISFEEEYEYEELD